MVTFLQQQLFSLYMGFWFLSSVGSLANRHYFGHRPSLGLFLSAFPFSGREEEQEGNNQQQQQHDQQPTSKPFSIQQNSDSMNGFTPVIDRFGFPGLQDISSDRFIRIDQEFTDPIHSITTTEQVWKQIHRVQLIQEQYGPSALLPRTWVSTASSSSSTVEQHTFSVAQFNTLAEGLSAGPHVKTPFPVDSSSNKEDDIGTYGGFTSIPHPQVVLDFSQRKWRLLQVLLTSNGPTQPCDILAMEEIDRYHGFFAPMLRIFGYQGVFVPKTKSPGVTMGWYSDGCALFWNSKFFEMVSHRSHGYSLGNQVALHVVLRHRLTSKSLVVVVTHLKSKCNAINDQIRTKQIQELLAQVEDTVQSVLTSSDRSNVPILILGDFNTDPPKKDPPVASHESSLNQMTTCYKSLYPLDSSTHYTTWKTRGSMTVKRVIGYIFYRGPLRPVATLGVPEETALEPTKLPGLRYPSDHILIAGRFHLD